MILITGASGFIGSAVALALNRRGDHDLVLCDRFGTGPKWKNLLGVRHCRVVHADQLFSYLAGNPPIDAIVHLGACSTTTETDMDYLLDNNVDFSIRLCRWAADRDVRFVYASSAAVYGDGTLGFSDADDLTARLRPLNKYGFSKWLFDMWLRENGLGNTAAGIRYFNVFGPNEYHKGAMASVVFRSFPAAQAEGRIRLFESCRDDIAHGEQARDFIYIDDAVAITLFLLDTPAAGGIFNAGTGRAHTFNQLARAVFDGLHRPPAIEYFPMPAELRDRYQYYTCAQTERLQQAGYTLPPDRFAEQVARYVKDYLAPGCRYAAEVEA